MLHADGSWLNGGAAIGPACRRASACRVERRRLVAGARRRSGRVGNDGDFEVDRMDCAGKGLGLLRRQRQPQRQAAHRVGAVACSRKAHDRNRAADGRLGRADPALACQRTLKSITIAPTSRWRIRRRRGRRGVARSVRAAAAGRGRWRSASNRPGAACRGRRRSPRGESASPRRGRRTGKSSRVTGARELPKRPGDSCCSGGACCS